MSDALETTGQGFDAVEVYSDGGVDKILAEITASARAIPQDVTTAKGRKAIASLGHKVARVKVHLDGLGKDLAAEWKDKVRAVDTERKRLRDTLNDLKEEILAPKTEWDQAEAERIEEIRGRIGWFEAMVVQAQPYFFGSDVIAEAIANVEASPINDLFGEFVAEAAKAKDEALASLRKLRASRWAREQELAELERLRAEAEERERVEMFRVQEENEEKERRAAKLQQEERDQRIREEAETKARDDAAVLAEMERVKARTLADAKLNEEKQARQDAERAAEAAETAIERAKLNAEIAIQKEKRLAELAERTRVEEVKAIEAVAKRREANKRNRAKVMAEITADIDMLPGDTHKGIAKAIAAGQIRHVQVVW